MDSSSKMFALMTRSVNIKIYSIFVLVIAPLMIICINNLMTASDTMTIRCYYEKTEKNNISAGKIITNNFSLRNYSRSLEKRKNKTILFWTKMFESTTFYFGDHNVFAECPVSSCFSTADRNYQPVEKFDAVMFHGPELLATDLPGKRSMHQRYIFVDLETPVNDPVSTNTAFLDFFNWTMVYRRDADIMWPYGIVKQTLSNEIMPPDIPIQWKDVSSGMVSEKTHKLFAGKNKTAAWFVSNCKSKSGRKHLVEALQEHIVVDVYGACGTLKCSQKNSGACYTMLEQNYFYYMSFENSLCRDYLTEKVYIPLRYDVIPVVYGSADYASFLPPGSYIDASAFDTPKDLASFLIELSKDEESYLSYFKWKSFYKVEHSQQHICELCKSLHDEKKPRKTIRNIHEWWTGGAGCVAPPSQWNSV